MTDIDLVNSAARLRTSRVLCVGDIMLDHYVNGQVDRISPEAPVPVLRVESEDRRLGGAGNVVRNLHALGASTCFISATGSDSAGQELRSMLDSLDGVEAIVFAEPGRTTTTKTRLVAAGQQLLRADSEHCVGLGPEMRASVISAVSDALPRHQTVIISDYAKGVVADGVALEIIAACRAAAVAVIVDPKSPNFGVYRGADLIKPNQRELSLAVGESLRTEEEIVRAARQMIDRYEFSAMLVTRGSSGMLLVGKGGDVHALPARAREVYDVSGAGDTVAATLGAAIAAGIPLLYAARLANVAAGLVVAKAGTAVVDDGELMVALQGAVGSKILPLPLLAARVEKWRQGGLKVGFTNGCFDILHPGHVSLLREARAACDRLIVGLNGDASAARLKGPGRPLQNAQARAEVLASLEVIDAVVVFDDDTPAHILAQLRPDVLVKGGDYRHEQVVGADLVESYGGSVLLARFLPGYSTTATIARAFG